ncbi:MAG: alkaline phosphatase family protein [Gemmataceae bacterium]
MRLLLLLAGLAGLASFSLGRPAPPRKPKLAVLVFFDQMRGDYLSRWAGLYEKDGFNRLTGDGAWFTDCHYPYANTMTGPGHATCSTGCSPDAHGVVANDWYDPKAGKEQYCAGSVRYRQVPPPLPLSQAEEAKLKKKEEPTGATPEWLLAPTLGDALKAATGGKGKVVALSLKDRSAVLPAGKRPDAVYWADRDGRWVTSTFYRDKVHPWVDEMNHSTLGLSWLNTKWTKLRPGSDYARHSGPDDGPGEDKGASQGVSFPHPFDGGPKKLLSSYYGAVANSPAGNDLLLEAVRRAVVAEKLGQGDHPDLLSVSFSSNDLVGHTWGPDSQEVLDVTLRSDLIVRDLLRFLDEKVGKGNYVLAMSADHGICPLPEAMRVKGVRAARVSPKSFFADAEKHLSARFPANDPTADGKKPTAWFAKTVSNMAYFNRAVLKARGTTPAEASRELVKWLVKRPTVEAAFASEDLATADGQIAERVRRSYRADRSGDVTVVLKPYHFFSTSLAGTTHGSPYPYDTHVPLVAFGAGVRPGVRKERVTPEAAAVILAEGLGIAPPAKAAVKVPAGLFGGRGGVTPHPPGPGLGRRVEDGTPTRHPAETADP